MSLCCNQCLAGQMPVEEEKGHRLGPLGLIATQLFPKVRESLSLLIILSMPFWTKVQVWIKWAILKVAAAYHKGGWSSELSLDHHFLYFCDT